MRPPRSGSHCSRNSRWLTLPCQHPSSQASAASGPLSADADASPLALLGTIVGAWDEGDATDLGLTKVLPAQLLSDLLGQEDEVDRRHEAEQGPPDDSWLADA